MVGLILFIIKTAVTNVCFLICPMEKQSVMILTKKHADITENNNNFQFHEFEFALTYNQME